MQSKKFFIVISPIVLTLAFQRLPRTLSTSRCPLLKPRHLQFTHGSGRTFFIWERHYNAARRRYFRSRTRSGLEQAVVANGDRRRGRGGRALDQVAKFWVQALATCCRNCVDLF